MKKTAGIIAAPIMAAILLLMALSSCSGAFTDPGMMDTGRGGMSSGGGSHGGGGKGSLSGTYKSDGWFGSDEITFRGSNFTVKESFWGYVLSEYSGTYTKSGDTVICTITNSGSSSKEVGDTIEFTIIDSTTLESGYYTTWKKQ